MTIAHRNAEMSRDIELESLQILKQGNAVHVSKFSNPFRSTFYILKLKSQIYFFVFIWKQNNSGIGPKKKSDQNSNWGNSMCDLALLTEAISLVSLYGIGCEILQANVPRKEF